MSVPDGSMLVLRQIEIGQRNHCNMALRARAGHILLRAAGPRSPPMLPAVRVPQYETLDTTVAFMLYWCAAFPSVATTAPYHTARMYTGDSTSDASTVCRVIYYSMSSTST